MADEPSIWGRPGVPRPRVDEPGLGGRPPRPAETPVGGGPRPTRPRPSDLDNPVPSVTRRNPPIEPQQVGWVARSKLGMGLAGGVACLAAVGLIVTRSDSTDSAVTNVASIIEPVDSTLASAVTEPPAKSDTTRATVAVASGNASAWESIARSVVFIEADGSACGWTGSGSLVGDGSYVLTNQHVAGDGECDLTVWLTDSTASVPTKSMTGNVIISDDQLDLAILRLSDSTGGVFKDGSRAPIQFADELPQLGDKLTILGYPGIGGSTITLTSGDYSGLDNSEEFDFLKTTANMNPGVSGGVALNAEGKLVGIPTAGRGAEVVCDGGADCVANGSTIGLLRPAKLAQQLLKQAQSTNG